MLPVAPPEWAFTTSYKVKYVVNDSWLHEDGFLKDKWSKLSVFWVMDNSKRGNLLENVMDK